MQSEQRATDCVMNTLSSLELFALSPVLMALYLTEEPPSSRRSKWNVRVIVEGELQLLRTWRQITVVRLVRRVPSLVHGLFLVAQTC